MNSVMKLSSSQAIEGLLSLIKAKEPILDTTFGSGTFWKGSKRVVVSGDKNPTRAKTLVLDFLNLPFSDSAFPTVVYDPPFHPGHTSADIERYSHLGDKASDLKPLFQRGVRECWRVTRNHLIIKCQSFVNARQVQWMPLWAIEVCGDPFEWLTVHRENKRISSTWNSVLSLRRNHADYLVFSKRGNYHI